MQMDPFADALAAVKNARSVGKQACEIRPASGLLREVLKVMQEKGYIGIFEYIDDGEGGMFRVNLNPELNECEAIKPRFHVKKDDYLQYEKRFLPARSFGHLIVSTSNGIMTQEEARGEIGGSLLAYVY